MKIKQCTLAVSWASFDIITCWSVQLVWLSGPVASLQTVLYYTTGNDNNDAAAFSFDLRLNLLTCVMRMLTYEPSQHASLLLLTDY